MYEFKSFFYIHPLFSKTEGGKTWESKYVELLSPDYCLRRKDTLQPPSETAYALSSVPLKKNTIFIQNQKVNKNLINNKFLKNFLLHVI